MQQKQTDTNDSVKLKPILGIKPGVYLTVLYSLILAIFLFWLLIYDGLINYGTVLDIQTEPQGAAIRVNDVYLGVSGDKIPLPNIVKPGEPIKITAILPGFNPINETFIIPGRVFGTRFFPRVFKLNFTLETNDPVGVLAEAAGEFAHWTFGGEPTEAWQVPLVLSEAVYRIQGTGSREQGSEILHAASRFATTRAALRDLTRAKFLLDNGGNVPSPLSAIGSMQDILVFLSENPESSEWLASLLPPENAKIVRESDWYKNSQSARRSPFNLSFKTDSFGTRRFNLEGLSFLGTDDFLFSENSVSKNLFERFLTEKPEFKDQYFDYFEDEITRHPAQIFDTSVVTGVSWHAAVAFCRWLTDRLPAHYANHEVRLPEEEEWKFAHNLGIIRNNPGWEWCLNPFSPLDFNTDKNAINAVSSPERTIYSGESHNPPYSEGKHMIRSSLPPDFMSPAVTFRPVITKK